MTSPPSPAAPPPWRASASSPDRVDGVVPCAGVAGLTDTDSRLVVSLNFFGAIALVTGLRPLMRQGSSVVLVSSNSVTAQPGWSAEVTGACLADDEERARRVAAHARRRARLSRDEGCPCLLGPP